MKTINTPNKVKVLIIDNDQDYRNYYKKWVSELGFSPIPISNLVDAQNVIESQEVDIAIVDLFLEEHSDRLHPKGLLLIRDIIEHNKNGKGPSIIVVTGDPGTTPRIMAEITEYTRRGLVTACLSKDKEDLKGDLQSELRALGEKIQSDFRLDQADNPDASRTQPLRVFLCHSSGDKEVVHRLYQSLNAEGDIDPWLDEEKILPGQDWNYEIEGALRASDAIIICLSAASVRKEGYVQKEVNRALDIAEEKPEGTIFIIPLKLDECELPRRISRWQSVNLFEKEGYDKLLRSLRHRAKMLKN